MARTANPNGTETDNTKQIRIPKKVHEAFQEAGRPFGFSTQRVMYLMLESFFGSDEASVTKNVKAHLTNTVANMAKKK